MKFVISTIWILFFLSDLAHAKYNFNCSDQSQKTQRENPYLITKEGTIPLFRAHNLKPSKKNIILTDVKQNSYNFCNTKKNKHYKRKFSSNYDDVHEKYERLYTKNLQDVLDYGSLEKHEDFEEIPDFAMYIFNLHHDCLSGERGHKRACKDVQKLVNNFQMSNAFTQNKVNTHNPQIYFDAINRFLKPLLLAYSTSSQVIGRSDTDRKIREWALKAIFQNTYDPFEKKDLKINSYKSFREKDMMR